MLNPKGHWESAFTTSYDAYRMAAEAVVLVLGYRVPAVAGAHRITIDIAQAAVGSEADAFAGAAAERFRTGRREAEYFDPDRPVEKTEGDARWGIEKAIGAIAAVTSALSPLHDVRSRCEGGWPSPRSKVTHEAGHRDRGDLPHLVAVGSDEQAGFAAPPHPAMPPRCSPS